VRIVAALGGNALLQRGEAMSAAVQRANTRHAAQALTGLVRAGHRLIITHGNGPQVGLLAVQAEAGPKGENWPLDVLDAESQGMIGYVIEQEMRNALGPATRIATLLTQIRVAPDDPAFRAPTKPIGATYGKEEADRLAAARGWRFAPDRGAWRRVVPSPEPLEIMESGVISLLVEQGVLVICTGGGGIPVVTAPDGALYGVEAVIDKDLASALLARQMRADMLLMLTDVEAVFQGYGTPEARPLGQLSIEAAEALLGALPAGSMRPKLAAAIGFARATGGIAVIGRLEQADALVTGTAGTRVGATTAASP